MMDADLSPRWRDVRVPYAVPLALTMCAAAFAGIMYLSRSFSFFYDEWDFVLGAPQWTLRSYFLPHGEHWLTFPTVVYKLLFTAFGAGSYAPFMAALLLLHVSVACLLFVLVRRRCGDLLALGATALLLLLGRAYEDLLWAFQVGFVGSAAFGLLAIQLLDSPRASRARPAMASAALVLSLASSGEGLFFCAAAAVELALDAGRRRRLWTLLAPAGAYAAWYLEFGSRTVASPRSPFTLEAVQSLVGYVPVGVGAVAAGLFALPVEWSGIALAALAATLALVWYRAGRVDGRVLGAAAGIVLQFALTGLVRAQFGDLEAASPRYVYIGAVFLLLILPEAVRNLPWRGLWRPALVVVVALSVAGNGLALRQAAAEKHSVFGFQDAELQTAWLFRDAPGLDPAARIDPRLMPQVTAGAYYRSREELGSPLKDATLDGLGSLHPDAVNQSMRNIMPLRTRLGSAPQASSGCPTVDPSRGYVDLRVPGGSTVTVLSTVPGQVGLNLWYVGSKPDAPAQAEQLPPARALAVTVPDTGRGLSWHLRVREPAYASGPVCIASGVNA